MPLILCFECPDEQKREIDRAIGHGRYRDYSELITVAIANQLLLDKRAGASAGFVLEPTEMATRGAEQKILRLEPTADGRVADQQGQSKSLATTVENEIAGSGPSEAQVVQLFIRPKGIPKQVRIARVGDDVFEPGEQVPLERWTLGLYNKILPAKVSVRAIANLLAANPAGVDLNSAALQIAREAKIVGDAFELQDSIHETERDDRLSTAFPLSSNDEKAISRFANQFVGAVNSRGQYSGLLAALKLIGHAGSSKQKVLLTQAGWNFALLENPCVDRNKHRPRLSADEAALLCKHVKEHVPQESTCIETILKLINDGKATPDQLDNNLKGLVSKKFVASDSFIATQRTGAISRMSDLGLIERHREGTRVTYAVTKRGFHFLREGFENG